MSISESNFGEGGLFSEVQCITCKDGYLRKVYNIPSSKVEEASNAINEVLKSIWSAIDQDDKITQYCKSSLAEFGINLDIEKCARGLDANAGLTDDLIIKDKGDLAEVIGYISERDFRTVPEEDIFAPITFEKRKAGVTIPGIDALVFVFTNSDVDELVDGERLFICEWKHTSDVSSVATPCRDTVSFYKGMSFQKLFQEIMRVKLRYKRMGQVNKGRKTLLFLPEFAIRSDRVLLASLIVFDSAIDIDKAGDEIETKLVEPLTKKIENPYNSNCIEVILFPIENFHDFYMCCYKDLRPY